MGKREPEALVDVDNELAESLSAFFSLVLRPVLELLEELEISLPPRDLATGIGGRIGDVWSPMFETESTGLRILRLSGGIEKP